MPLFPPPRNGGPTLFHAPIHRSAWKGYSPNFAKIAPMGDASVSLPPRYLGSYSGTGRGSAHLSSSAPQSGAADDRWASRTEEGPGLQERLGGRPFRADGDVPREPEPLAMGGAPREAGVLPGPPRRAAGPRDAGAQVPRLIPAFLRDTSA